MPTSRGCGRFLTAVVAVVVGLSSMVGQVNASPVRGPTKPATFNGPNGRQARWVLAENQKPGTTSWQISGAQTATGILGYTDMVQAQVGQRVTLYVSTEAPAFKVEAFRMGYYHGRGARLVWRSKELAGSQQATCPVTPGINMVQCAWKASLSLLVTKQWVQGEYLLKLVGSEGQQSYVPLTVWAPASRATYVIMDPVLTTQVFNPFGGYDLYQGATPCAPKVYPCSTRARVVSFDRPYGYGNGAGTYLTLVYPLTRLAEEDGLDVTYWTDITLATDGSALRHHTVLISAGHDEEWSLAMRDAAVTAAQSGVNLIFFGASAILRKVRLEASPLGADRQIVNYRDPQQDPLYGTDDAQVSQNQWIQPPANWSPSELLGANYIGFDNSPTAAPLVDSDPPSWLFAGTGLTQGQAIPSVLSNDFQAYQPSAPNPANVEILSHSPVQVELHGESFADTTYYTMASSEAGVFQSGTTEWIPSLAPCVPAQVDCPATSLAKLTDTLLRVFGQGPVGLRHPSVANWQQFYP